MKKLNQFLTFTFAALLFVACKNNAKPEVKTVETTVKEVAKAVNTDANYSKAEFTINGMSCPTGCAKKIESKLGKMEGVKSAKVDFDRKLAMVEYETDKVTTADLQTTVTKVADVYKVADMKTVDAFSKKQCKPGCSKTCCTGEKNKEGKKDKKSCKPGCTKTCCTSKEDKKAEKSEDA